MSRPPALYISRTCCDQVTYDAPLSPSPPGGRAFAASAHMHPSPHPAVVLNRKVRLSNSFNQHIHATESANAITLSIDMSGPFLRRPIIPRGIAVADLLGARYALAWAPFRLDSGRQMHSAALSLPRTLLFSRKLRVSDVEVVNHDTKRITFHLPGGNGEVSGVSPGCKS